VIDDAQAAREVLGIGLVGADDEVVAVADVVEIVQVQLRENDRVDTVVAGVDDVVAVAERAGVMVLVGARTAVQRVRPFAAAERVVAFVAGHVVIAAAALDRVMAGKAMHYVGNVRRLIFRPLHHRAVLRVIPVIGRHHVVERRSIDCRHG
jgi:hypothetical protein